jgi:putative transposase
LKRKRITEEQIITILKAHEAGVPVADLSRKHGFSEGTLYTWKTKFGGMEVSDAKRLRELEAENSKLKKLLAESLLDQNALKEALSRKW